jgi:hypothetical protein
MIIMTQQVHILIADDDMGHVALTRRNLQHLGLVNLVIHFNDGQEVLNFLFRKADGPHWQGGYSYLLLRHKRFVKAIRELGLFFKVIESPRLSEGKHLL